MSTIMNKFTDVLKDNMDKLINTETLPGLVLTVQKTLVEHNLENTRPAHQLVNALLHSTGHDEAIQTLFKFMI